MTSKNTHHKYKKHFAILGVNFIIIPIANMITHLAPALTFMVAYTAGMITMAIIRELFPEENAKTPTNVKHSKKPDANTTNTPIAATHANQK